MGRFKWQKLKRYAGQPRLLPIHEGRDLAATRELINEILRRNELHPELVISAFFTATPDLTAAFPAEAVRQLGYTSWAALDGTDVGAGCITTLYSRPAPCLPGRNCQGGPTCLHTRRRSPPLRSARPETQILSGSPWGTDWNVENRIQGCTDTPLNQQGREGSSDARRKPSGAGLGVYRYQ